MFAVLCGIGKKLERPRVFLEGRIQALVVSLQEGLDRGRYACEFHPFQLVDLRVQLRQAVLQLNPHDGRHVRRNAPNVRWLRILQKALDEGFHLLVHSLILVETSEAGTYRGSSRITAHFGDLAVRLQFFSAFLLLETDPVTPGCARGLCSHGCWSGPFTFKVATFTVRRAPATAWFGRAVARVAHSSRCRCRRGGSGSGARHNTDRCRCRRGGRGCSSSRRRSSRWLPLAFVATEFPGSQQDASFRVRWVAPVADAPHRHLGSDSGRIAVVHLGPLRKLIRQRHNRGWIQRKAPAPGVFTRKLARDLATGHRQERFGPPGPEGHELVDAPSRRDATRIGLQLLVGLGHACVVGLLIRRLG